MERSRYTSVFATSTRSGSTPSHPQLRVSHQSRTIGKFRNRSILDSSRGLQLNDTRINLPSLPQAPFSLGSVNETVFNNAQFSTSISTTSQMLGLPNINQGLSSVSGSGISPIQFYHTPSINQPLLTDPISLDLTEFSNPVQSNGNYGIFTSTPSRMALSLHETSYCYRCHKCGRSFSMSTSWVMHMKWHHRIEHQVKDILSVSRSMNNGITMFNSTEGSICAPPSVNCSVGSIHLPSLPGGSYEAPLNLDFPAESSNRRSIGISDFRMDYASASEVTQDVASMHTSAATGMAFNDDRWKNPMYAAHQAQSSVDVTVEHNVSVVIETIRNESF